MNLLAIDPGTVSGWAIVINGKVTASGTVRVDSAKGFRWAHHIIERAAVLDITTVIIEGCGYFAKGSRWDTVWGLGRRAGIWECLARTRGLSVEYVHPNTWQTAMLHVGKRNPGREMLKRLSVARARAIVGHDVTSDEADAICIADYWMAKETA